MTEQPYVGNELEIFARALRWKAYYKSHIARYFGGRLLEVGAGLGATTAALCDSSQSEWLCLEPDSALAAEIDRKIQRKELPRCCRTQVGTVAELAPDQAFDSIIYIDVLEHIQQDARELEEASLHLKRGGSLIVLSPAYPFLYSPFDRAIGHYRRYTRLSLTALTPKGCRITKLIFLDSVGLLTSLANRLFLRQSIPTERQILFWDQRLIPLSKVIDRLLGYRVGRSVVGIWERIA